jgi:glycosyl transferase, family 25
MKRIIESFDRAYIINLEDRLDRRREAEREFSRIGINVPNKTVEFYTAKRLVDKGSFPDVGTRGCFISHRGVLDRACRDKLRNVLVFEDDVSFRNVDDSLEDQILRELRGTRWDIVYFGYLSPSDTGQKGPLISLSSGVLGAHFYAVNGPFIAPLLRFMTDCERRPPGHPDGGPMPADGALNHIRRHIPEMRVLLAVPNLAHQRSSRSDITSTHLFDRITSLRPLLHRVRAIKHKLRMLADRKNFR